MSVHSAKPVRGTRDILPDEMNLRVNAERIISDTYRKAGFDRIETPALEDIDLLLGSEGGENLKMLFTILKRGDKFRPQEESKPKDLCDIGLRFDLTLPLSRYYSNNRNSLPLPFKALQMGNVFRAERPQKGRYRSFKQCDIDIIGEPGISAEIELVHTTGEAMKNLGFEDFTIVVSDRRLINAYLEKNGFLPEETQSVCIALDKIDKIGNDGAAREIAEKFPRFTQEQIARLVDEVAGMDLEQILSITGEGDTVRDLRLLIDTANAASGGKYSVVFDFSLIRGMGYYTGPIFEIRVGEGSSVGGGGRYDEMIGKTSKQSVPAVGFSIGFERVVNLLAEREAAFGKKEESLTIFYGLDDDLPGVLKKADELREQGFRVILTQKKKKLGRQINACEEAGQSGFMVYGRDEEPRRFDAPRD